MLNNSVQLCKVEEQLNQQNKIQPYGCTVRSMLLFMCFLLSCFGLFSVELFCGVQCVYGLIVLFITASIRYVKFNTTQ